MYIYTLLEQIHSSPQIQKYKQRVYHIQSTTNQTWRTTNQRRQNSEKISKAENKSDMELLCLNSKPKLLEKISILEWGCQNEYLGEHTNRDTPSYCYRERWEIVREQCKKRRKWEYTVFRLEYIFRKKQRRKQHSVWKGHWVDDHCQVCLETAQAPSIGAYKKIYSQRRTRENHLSLLNNHLHAT